MNRSLLAAVLVVVCLSPPALSRQANVSESVFLEAWRIAKIAFYDPAMKGVDWDSVRDELLPAARGAATQAERSAVINRALSRLHASHTAHYFQDQREYYELLDIFFPDGVPPRADSAIRPGPATYVGIGLATRQIDGKAFAEEVFAGGPAAAAGILAGDQIVAVDDGPWGDVAPFRDREGTPTKVTIQRTADPASRRDIEVIPTLIRPRELFLTSMKASARIIQSGSVRIAYVRLWAYTHPDLHEALKDLLADRFKEADALILDVRGGWGGASPAYMDIFNPVAPTLTRIDREGRQVSFQPAWHKPAAMIIDGASRSGKEVNAYAFRKHRIGLLVGERTAGAVLAGTTRPLSDGSVLYFAVNDVRVDGERLEGIGVEPDIAVPRNLPYSQGKDPQIDAAVGALAKQASVKSSP